MDLVINYKDDEFEKKNEGKEPNDSNGVLGHAECSENDEMNKDGSDGCGDSHVLNIVSFIKSKLSELPTSF